MPDEKKPQTSATLTLGDNVRNLLDTFEAPFLKRRNYSKRRALIQSSLITLIAAAIGYYLYLPALNFKDYRLYLFLGLTAMFYLCLRLMYSDEFDAGFTTKQFGQFFWKRSKIMSLLFCLVVMAALIGCLISNQLVASRSYHALLDVEEGDFTEDVYSISFEEIPSLDSSSASELGTRALGELSDIVSQYEIEELYTQINYHGVPVRVASLKYGDIFKWVTNQKNGLPGYVMVNMVTQQAAVVRLGEGIRISPSERFNRDLTRTLRFRYPTYIFDTPHLEINEDGDPYWICPRVDKKIGLFGGTDIVGAVIMSAVNGSSESYNLDQIPQWVDQVYSSELLLRQYSYYGKYGKGFFNSLLGQSGVTKTTEGCNYIALDDDVYMYTGITSATSDNSNIGFVLCNQRTKESRFYSISGATEQSAMSSAAGMVQHLSYTATYPLLLNVADQPTYFIPLKDNADLVKMYAMVNVSQYQHVSVGESIRDCERNYVQELINAGVINSEMAASAIETDPIVTEQITGVIDEVYSCVVDGTTLFYIQLQGEDTCYQISASEAPDTAIARPGDAVVITARTEETGRVRTAISVAFAWEERP
jgi:hypothetical protein